MTEQNLPTCPFCDSDKLTCHVYDDEIQYNERPLRLNGLTSYVCGTCNEQSIFPEQARANQTIIADAKRHADNLLTGTEIRELRERLGISQEEAANIFGGGRNGFSKYERGEVIQSVAMDRLMRITLISPEIFDFLCSLANVASRVNQYEYLTEDRKVIKCSFNRSFSRRRIRTIFDQSKYKEYP